MSGSLGEDTMRTLASGRQTVWSMLSAAQSHLKKVFLVFVITFVVTIYLLYSYLWEILKQDLVFNHLKDGSETAKATEIVTTNPFEVILIQVKIGAIVAAVVSLPLVIWYSRGALKRRGYWPAESIPLWKIAGFVLMTVFLGLGGLSYGYFVFFPFMFSFLAENATKVGFKPTWSIAMWTEFILFLSLSFALAAQLPLAMSTVARAGIVKYETFRDKWRLAVLGIVVFGAVFSPPDPFTQIMWAAPLVLLYGVSLGITKFAVLSKRVGNQAPVRAVAADHWNELSGVLLLGAAGMYVYLLEGGLTETNRLLAWAGSSYRFPTAEQISAFGLSSTITGTIGAVLFGLVLTGIALFYFRIQALESMAVAARKQQEETADETTDDETEQKPGEPAEIDIGSMSARAIEAAPPEAFRELSQERALHYAEQAVENDNHEKGQAILDSFDEAQELETEETEDEQNVLASTAAGIFDSFSDGETTEDDIGGYYYDIAFILESLTSKAIWVVGTFLLVMVLTFGFLYKGGIGLIIDIFAKGMPAQMADQLKIVTLHPVEGLIFMLKFSTALGAVATLPVILYFTWPAIEERGVTTGNRNVWIVWGATMVLTLITGTAVGFLYIAPGIISLLASDVVSSNMIIAYRIKTFGWLIIYFTVGIGFLSLIPMSMLLFHFGNIVSYERMRKSWRGAIIGCFAVAGVISPAGLYTMLIVAIPAALAYLSGLAVLWTISLFTRQTPQRRRETAD